MKDSINLKKYIVVLFVCILVFISCIVFLLFFNYEHKYARIKSANFLEVGGNWLIYPDYSRLWLVVESFSDISLVPKVFIEPLKEGDNYYFDDCVTFQNGRMTEYLEDIKPDWGYNNYIVLFSTINTSDCVGVHNVTLVLADVNGLRFDSVSLSFVIPEVR